MNEVMSPQRISNWHRSNVLLFVFMGASWTALATRMPVVKADLGVTASQLGLILLGMGIGSLIGLNLIGRMIAKSGTRRWLMIFYPTLAGLVIVNAMLIENHLTIAYAVMAFLMGGLMGMTDVSVNVDGTALEKATNRILMPRMHAGYSVGTLAGAGWGVLCASADLSLVWTVLPLGVIAFVLPFIVSKHLPSDIGIETAAPKQ
ncbi:MAG: hypothetical protein RL454_650, partial [Actinomycetota bacterium]